MDIEQQGKQKFGRGGMSAVDRLTSIVPIRVRRWLPEICVVLGLLAVLMGVYYAVVFGRWSFSYTNCLYRWRPFSSSGVDTWGYCYSDITDNVLPIAFTTIHQGVFTDWVPAFSIGASQGMNLYLSPVNYLYLLPFSIAMPLISVVKIAVSFAGMYAFICQLGYSRKGGFIAGTTYALSAAMIAWQGWPHTEVGMWAPWLFFMIDRVIKQIKIGQFVIIAVLVFLMLSAGMPTFAAYFFYVAVVYAIVFCLRTYWGDWKRIGVVLGGGIAAMGLGAMLSLPYTGELLTSVGSNGYSDSRSGWSTIGLGLPQLKTLLFPFLNTSTTLNNIESMLYTGVLAVVALPLVFIRWRKKPRNMFFAITAAVILLLLFTPVFDVIFTHMPMINTSYKFRIVIILNFALAIVLGINMDDVLSRTFATAKEALYVWIAFLCGFAVFVIVLWRVHTTPLTNEAVGENQIIIACIAVVAYALVLVLKTVFIKHGNTVVSVICTLAICGAVGVDGAYFASQYMPLIEKGASAIPEATSTIEYLQQHTKNQEKIVSKNVDLPVDSGMFYGLRDIRGHGFLMTDPHVKAFYEAIDDSAYQASPTNTVFLDAENENMLRYIGVKYIVSSEDMESDPEYATEEGMHAVGDDGLLIKEIEGISPEVQLIENVSVCETNADVIDAMSADYLPNTVFFSEEDGAPEGDADVDACNVQIPAADEAVPTVEEYITQNAQTERDIIDVERESDGDMTITIDADASDRFLLVNEFNDGGWKAYVDGEEVPVYMGNGLFRAIPVSEGQHTIEIRHESAELRILFVAAIVAAVILLVVSIIARPLNRHSLRFTDNAS